MKAKQCIYFLLVLLAIISCKSDERHFTIYSIGDSTMASKGPDRYPQNGWAQAFPGFLIQEVTFRNHATGGNTSKAFINSGRWQIVLDSLKPGDYVFIQFGHNDMKIGKPNYSAPFTDYKANLEKFIKETREKKATPILFTSIVRRSFDDNSQLINTLGDYPEAVRQTAIQKKITLIDLNKLTGDAIQKMGDEASKKLFMWIEPTENYPEGRKDNSHLNVEGAVFVSKLVADELKKQEHPISKYLK